MSVKAITLRILQETEVECLGDLVSEYVFALEDGAEPDERDGLIANLPLGLQIVYDLVSAESEVLNGGFLQFFYNSTGKRTLETVKAMHVIGASRRAVVFEEAIEFYAAKWGRPRTYRERWLHWHEPCAEEERLNNEYCCLSEGGLEPLPALIGKYIRDNSSEFVHPVA